ALPDAGAGPANAQPRMAYRPRGRTRLAIVGCSLAIIGALSAMWYRARTAPVPSAIAIMPFVNETSDSSLTRLGAVTADWISYELARLGLPTSTTGSALVVTGTYYARGSNVELHARIADRRSSAVL